MRCTVCDSPVEIDCPKCGNVEAGKTSLVVLVNRIRAIADLGSAQEFGDAQERLGIISRLTEMELETSFLAKERQSRL